MLQASSTVEHHAIVIGGSIAGLPTARVLTDYFERVTVLERDRFPINAPAPRKGVTPMHPASHLAYPWSSNYRRAVSRARGREAAGGSSLAACDR